MANLEGRTDFLTESSLDSQGTRTHHTEIYSIARYIPEGNASLLKDTSGIWGDLEAITEAEFERDASLGINYLKFREGAHYKSASDITLPEELTVAFHIRFKTLESDSPNRAFNKVGSLLKLGFSDVQIFQDTKSHKVDIQKRGPGFVARFETPYETESWMLIILPMTAAGAQALLGNIITVPTTFRSGENQVSSEVVFLGQDAEGRGYLDADISMLQVFKGTFNPAQMSGYLEVFENTIRPQITFNVSSSLEPSLYGLDYSQTVLMQTHVEFDARPTSDPGDLLSAIFWHNSKSNQFQGYAEGDRVFTWFDELPSTKNFASPSDLNCIPCYVTTEPASIKYPEEVKGLISCVASGLVSEEFTVLLKGTSQTYSGISFEVIQGFKVEMIQSSTQDRTTLKVTSNPDHLYEKSALFLDALSSQDPWEILIQVYMDAGAWVLDVYVDRVLITPTEAVVALETEDPILFDPCDPEIIFTPLTPYGTPYIKTFEVLKDLGVCIGNGFSYMQVIGYKKKLDSAELSFVYRWLDARY